VERLPIESAISRVALHLFRIDLIDIERRIGHHEIALAGQFVRVLVVGDRLVAGADASS
jgi:hypothetical protein